MSFFEAAARGVGRHGIAMPDSAEWSQPRRAATPRHIEPTERLRLGRPLTEQGAITAVHHFAGRSDHAANARAKEVARTAPAIGKPVLADHSSSDIALAGTGGCGVMHAEERDQLLRRRAPFPVCDPTPRCERGDRSQRLHLPVEMSKAVHDKAEPNMSAPHAPGPDGQSQVTRCVTQEQFFGPTARVNKRGAYRAAFEHEVPQTGPRRRQRVDDQHASVAVTAPEGKRIASLAIRVVSERGVPSAGPWSGE